MQRHFRVICWHSQRPQAKTCESNKVALRPTRVAGVSGSFCLQCTMEAADTVPETSPLLLQHFQCKQEMLKVAYAGSSIAQIWFTLWHKRFVLQLIQLWEFFLEFGEAHFKWWQCTNDKEGFRHTSWYRLSEPAFLIMIFDIFPHEMMRNLKFWNMRII